MLRLPQSPYVRGGDEQPPRLTEVTEGKNDVVKVYLPDTYEPSALVEPSL